MLPDNWVVFQKGLLQKNVGHMLKRFFNFFCEIFQLKVLKITKPLQKQINFKFLTKLMTHVCMIKKLNFFCRTFNIDFLNYFL
jgi:hypothetical protein